MWDAGKLLLATIIFTAVFYRLAAEETKQLDAAPNAVDYLYDNCSEEAKRKFTDSDVLEKELNNSELFKKAWEEIYKCSEQVPGGKKKQITALHAYVKAEPEFQKTFNDEVETKGVNVSTYENNFNFKSLHFLLMSSMEMHLNNCTTVYVCPEEDYHHEAENGSEVRLGRFMMAQESFDEVKTSIRDDDVILKITSCFFVSLRKNGINEDKLLLSPAEVFTVEEKYTVNNDDGYYTVIVLKHSSLKETDSCHLPRSHGLNISSQWLVLVLVALSLFFFNC